MKVFVVYAPPGSGGDPLRDAERMVFVKDGFCWPALFVPLLWLLWHRMWLVLLGWLAAVLVLTAGAALLDAADSVVMIAGLIFAVWFALEANGLRRWTLERRGWLRLGLASGRKLLDSERDFFVRWTGAVASPAPRPARAPVTPKLRTEPAEDSVIGLFPRRD